MASGEDWLYRPVIAGMLRAESLINCDVDLEYVATLNDALTVFEENKYRAQKANE